MIVALFRAFLMTIDGLHRGIEVEGYFPQPFSVPHLLAKVLIQIGDFDHLGLAEKIQSSDDRGFHRETHPVPQFAQSLVVGQLQDLGYMFSALNDRHQQNGDDPAHRID